MKTMLTLIAMLMVGNALAGRIFTEQDIDKIVAENKDLSDRLSAGRSENLSIHSNEEACRPTKVDYSIVTLPDGKTASVLTFKD